MSNVYQKPRLATPNPIRVRRFLRLLCGALVLLAVAFVLAWLFAREEQVRFCGIVDAGAENVGPVETARIVSVEVSPGQAVKAGDVIVRFDPAGRLLEEVMNGLKIRESEQKLLDDERCARRLVCESEVELEKTRMEQLREQAELAADDAEIARLSPLVERKIVSELELLALRPKADCLRRTVSAYGPLLASLSNKLAQAREDLAAVSKLVRAQLDDGVRTAEAAVSGTYGRESLVLRAMSDGIVSQVFHRPGDIVPAGEPIVRLATSSDSVRVTGMLPADRLDAVAVGDGVRVGRMPRFGATSADFEIAGTVEVIDREVLDFFDPNNPAPHTPVRGRKVRIRLVGDASRFIPGETVLVTAQGGGFWGRAM